MAEERASAHEAALTALLKGVELHAEASASATAISVAGARAAAAKDLAESYAWLRSVAQPH